MITSLTKSLPIVAAAYGKKLGIHIIIQGQQAYTDGNTIVIPATNTSNPQFKSLIWGYLSHEAAHIRFTDFDIVHHASDWPLRKYLLNIGEDCRIEAQLAKLYPGTRHHIQIVIDSLNQQGRLTPLPDSSNLSHFLLWLLLTLRHHQLKQQGLAQLLYEVEQKVLSAGILTASHLSTIQSLNQGVPNYPSTKDVLDWADTLITLLKETASSPIKNHSTPMLSESNLSAPSKLESLPSSSWLDSLPCESDIDIFYQAKEQLQQLAHEDAQPNDEQYTLPKEEKLIPNAQGLQLYHQTKHYAVHLRNHLHGLLQSQQRRDHNPKRMGYKINRKRLALSQSGYQKLFLREQSYFATNTALHILVDCSLSMKNRIIDKDKTQLRYCEIAFQAAMALALALEPIKDVSTSVTYFPGSQNDTVKAILSTNQHVAQRAGYFYQSPQGSTPMTEAIAYAASQLLLQSEPKKLLWVITDGEPDDEYSTQTMLKHCQKSGLITIGIGIGPITLADAFTFRLTLSDITQLTSQLFKLSEYFLKY